MVPVTLIVTLKQPGSCETMTISEKIFDLIRERGMTQKDFALKTLLSSLLYIGFTFLLKRVVFFENLALEFAGKSGGNNPVVGNYILCGLFGGVFVGGGCLPLRMMERK